MDGGVVILEPPNRIEMFHHQCIVVCACTHPHVETLVKNDSSDHISGDQYRFLHQ